MSIPVFRWPEYNANTIPLDDFILERAKRDTTDIKGVKDYIKFSNNTERLRQTICHEFLHNFIILNDYTHKIVYDVAKYKTCFIDWGMCSWDG